MLDRSVSKRHAGVEEALANVSTEFGPWTGDIAMTQERFNAYAQATGDNQWIHTDPARTAAQNPPRKTIAQGLLVIGIIADLQEAFTKGLADKHPNAILIHQGGAYAIIANVEEGARLQMRGKVSAANPGRGNNVRFTYEYEIAHLSGRAVAKGYMQLAAIFR